MSFHVDRDESIRRSTMAGMFGAVAAVLMLLDFPVPLVPPFVKFDLSELPVLLGGLFLGPVGGGIVAGLKILLHLVFRGSLTVGIGELANFTGSIAYMLPGVLLFRHRDSMRDACASFAAATVVVSVVIVVGNYFVFFPAYARLMGLSVDAFVAMGHSVNSSVHDLWTLMVYCLFPFNLFKYGVTSVLAALLYRRLRRFSVFGR